MITETFTNLAVDRVKKVESEKLQKKASDWILKVREAESRIIPLHVPNELKEAHRKALESNLKLEQDLREKMPEIAKVLDTAVDKSNQNLDGFFLPLLLVGIFTLTTGGIVTANRMINLKREELLSAEYRIKVYEDTFDVAYEQTGDADKAADMAWAAVAAAENEVMIRTLDEKISTNRKKMFYIGGAAVGLYFLNKFYKGK